MSDSEHSGRSANSAGTNPGRGREGPSRWAGFAFRFVFIYLLLFLSIRLLWFLPFVAFIAVATTPAWDLVVPWVGQRVLHWWPPYAVAGQDNPNSTFGWIQLACIITLALGGSAAWTLVRPRTHDYTRLHGLLRLFLRVTLCLTMTSYAFDKFFGEGQFGSPSLQRLVTPVGDLAPPALMWTFLGHSFSYGFATGVIELVGALLLLWERTTTLGAMVLIGVMGQLTLLNVFYDVGGAQFTIHLLLIAVFLLAPDVRMLVNVLVLRRPGTPRIQPSILGATRWRPLLRAALASYIALALILQLRGKHAEWQLEPDNELRGIYEVEAFVRNGVTVLPLTTDGTRWRRLVIEGSGYTVLHLMTDSLATFQATVDTTSRRLTLLPPPDSLDAPAFAFLARFAEPQTNRQSVLAYQIADSGRLVLSGMLRGDSVGIELRRRDDSQLLLKRWRLHLVSNLPLSATFITAPYAGFPVDPRLPTGPRVDVP